MPLNKPQGVTSGSTDVRLRWREVVTDDRPEFIVNFPEGHDLKLYLKGLIILGRPRHEVHVITSLDEGLPEVSYERGCHPHFLPIMTAHAE